ncbi:MAG: CvpA family protein [Rikenellaceae bacterium]
MGTSLIVLDLILLALFVPAIIGGITKGFIRQAAGLIALILGIWAGFNFSSLVSEKLRIWLDTTSSLINILSFAIIFIAVLLIVSLIGRLASEVIKLALMGWLDKILGVIFAIIKTAFILSIVIYILNSLDSLWNFLPEKSLADSEIYHFIEQIAPKLFPYIKNLQNVNLNI